MPRLAVVTSFAVVAQRATRLVGVGGIVTAGLSACSPGRPAADQATTVAAVPKSGLHLEAVTARPALEGMPPADLRAPEAAGMVATLSAARLQQRIAWVGAAFLTEDKCPRRKGDGGWWILGPCTGDNGGSGTGKAWVREWDDGWQVAAYGVRRTHVDECDGRKIRERLSLDGRVSSWGPEEDRHFAVDAVVTGRTCDVFLPAAVVYEGRMRRHGTAWRYSGQGEVGIFGWGKVSLRTDAETIDCRRCKSEPLSGQTEARAGDERLVIEYDGARDCTEEREAPYQLDSGATGKVQVPRPCCSSAPGAHPSWSAAALLAMGLGLLARRRAPRPSG